MRWSVGVGLGLGLGLGLGVRLRGACPDVGGAHAKGGQGGRELGVLPERCGEGGAATRTWLGLGPGASG